MKSQTNLLLRAALTATLAVTLAACSDSSDPPSPADQTQNDPITGDPVTGDPVTGDPVTGDPVTGDPVTGDPVTGDPVTGDPITGDPVPGDPVTGDPVTGDPVTGDPVTGDPVTGDPVTGDPIDPVPPLNTEPLPLEPAPRPVTLDLSEPFVPTLADPLANAVPSPSQSDPFGFGLDFNGDIPVAGGAPTQPKNLRLDLVSNNWAEINWAPSNDDGEVVQYTLTRDDGVFYVIRGDQTDISANAQSEIERIWETTSFIDCNYTRFNERLHQCSDGRQPLPGQTYIYTVKATDNEGNESVESEPLTVTYLEASNAPVPRYDDFFKDPNDSFAQDNDLSAVDHWLDTNFNLVFQDEFNGETLDPQKWQTRLTWGDETIINGEQQYFVNTQDNPDFGYDPFKFTGQSLIIEAVPVTEALRPNLPATCDDASRPDVDQCEFLSGALSSFDRFGFIYGYTEGRFKLSGASGALSSFYLYHRYKGTGTDFHAPEIDIVEYLGENPFGAEDAFQTYHYEVPGEIVRSSPTMASSRPDGGNYADAQWHTFGVLWEPQLVIWYINGLEVKRLAGPQVARRPMNIVNYLVAGSEWAPTPSNPADFPLRFEADYIRVYQRPAFASTAIWGPDQ